MRPAARPKEYTAWRNMLNRCLNPKSTKFAYYGGRGIGVSMRWRLSFAAFLEDVGPAPSPRHTLDRRDTDGDYKPGNVRWVTWSDQNRNTRKTRSRLARNGVVNQLTPTSFE